MNHKHIISTGLALSLLVISSCSNVMNDENRLSDPISFNSNDKSQYIISVEDEPDTVDFQCTTIFYDIAFTVFNRLVEMENDASGGVTIRPSLVESWEASDDGTRYLFTLRDDVFFSNGEQLTSSDVLYTFKRLLSHPDSCNRDIARVIVGATRFEEGLTDKLEGFHIISDTVFIIDLEKPYSPFLAALAMPGASILDEKTTEAAGELFGKEAAQTIGTGPFILEEWDKGKGMLLRANSKCFEGPPSCAGLDIRFMMDPVSQRLNFEDGELDILDLDYLGDESEFFIHGDIYQDKLFEAVQIGISYIALNENIKPLNDVRVRKALQLALNRQTLLDAACSSRGRVENGIFPYGLNGHNPDLPEIPYDPEEAKRLLDEAGLDYGFELRVSLKESTPQWQKEMMELASNMWKEVGIRARLVTIDDDEFVELRKQGRLACYTATWSADFNDPDNFIYTFFGSQENTIDRSLCYQNDAVIDRVHNARYMVDQSKRMEEYHELERIIVQEEAAWIPLFSRYHYYVINERIKGFDVAWNGWITDSFKNMRVETG